jgi:hypothetical protein
LGPITTIRVEVVRWRRGGAVRLELEREVAPVGPSARVGISPSASSAM